MNKKMIGRAVGVLLASCASVACAQQGLDPKQQGSDPKQQGSDQKEHAAVPRGVVVPHWYGGLALGQTILDLPDDALPVAGTSTLNKGHNKHGYKVFAGHRLHRNFALEAAYVDYGQFAATRFVTDPAPGSLSATIHITGLSLEGVGILPFDSGFSLYAKLGALYAMTHTAYQPQGSVAAPANQSPISRELTVKTGIGAGYALTERLSLRLEYEVAKKVGDETTVAADVKALFAGLQYRF
jgi:opacity protein-like surface antigen